MNRLVLEQAEGLITWIHLDSGQVLFVTVWIGSKIRDVEWVIMEGPNPILMGLLLSSACLENE